MIIGLDFDGTCVEHRCPDVGPPVPGAVHFLRKLTEHGHKLILWTCRGGKEQEAAVQWFKDMDLPLFGIQENPIPQDWECSNKLYCDIFIDDKGLGTPLTGHNPADRLYVDWKEVDRMLDNKGYYQ
jgi:hypothetical protein